jgi:hypothetical protein
MHVTKSSMRLCYVPAGLAKVAIAVAYGASPSLGYAEVSNTASGCDCSALATEWIEHQGQSLGYSQERDTLIVVRSASIGVRSSHPTYSAQRAAAIDTALKAARGEAAGFIRREIEARTSASTLAGDDELGKTAFALRDNASSVEVLSRAAIVGLSAWNTFECRSDDGGGMVCVVAALGPKYSRAARGVEAQAEPQQPLSKWFSSIDDGTLATTLGTRLMRDEQGRLRLVAFGQEPAKPGFEDEARDVASTAADGMLAFARGELVASRTLRESMSRQKERTGLPPQFDSRTKFDQAVEANASVKGIKIEPVGQRVVSVGSHRVAVVARAALIDPSITSSPASPESSSAKAEIGCPPVPPAMAKAVRAVRAAGLGRNRSIAVEKALLDAIKQQGVDVKGNSELERRYEQALKSVGEEVAEKVQSSTVQKTNVKSFANGFIHSYEVLSETKEGDLVRIDICANLVEFDPKNPRFGLPPTLALIPFPCPPGGVKAGGEVQPCDEIRLLAEQPLEQAVAQSRKFDIIDEKSQPLLASVRRQIADKVSSGESEEIEAIKLGKQLTADYVLVGAVRRAEFTGLAGKRPQKIAASDNASATVEARLINVTSNEVFWSDSKTVSLTGREILLVRRDGPPEQASLSPVEIACYRATQVLVESLKARLGDLKAGESSQAAQSSIPAAPAGITIVRVARGAVTLDASDARVRPGAKFVINSLVEVKLPNGRVAVDRDRLAVIEVVSVADGLAKASVIEGDATLIDAGTCEVVPLSN